jgi:hypothetical protein
MPNLTALSKSSPRSSARSVPATRASPAPVVSTDAAGGPRICMPSTVAPSLPRRRTIALAFVPPKVADSSSLMKSRSTLETSSGRRRTFAMLVPSIASSHDEEARRSMHASSSVGGTLQSSKTHVAPSMRVHHPSRSDSVSASTARVSAAAAKSSPPGDRIAAYCGVGNTWLKRTLEASTPISARWVRIAWPSSSSPTIEQRATETPSRARFSATLRATPPKLRVQHPGFDVPVRTSADVL